MALEDLRQHMAETRTSNAMHGAWLTWCIMVQICPFLYGIEHFIDARFKEG